MIMKNTMVTFLIIGLPVNAVCCDNEMVKQQILEVTEQNSITDLKEFYEASIDCVDFNAKYNHDNTLLHKAVLKKFDIEIIKFLLEHGANINSININKETPLMAGAGSGSLEAVKQLVSYGDTSINATNRSGKTALMLAAKENELEVVQYLIDQGADVNAKGQLIFSKCSFTLNYLF